MRGLHLTHLLHDGVALVTRVLGGTCELDTHQRGAAIIRDEARPVIVERRLNCCHLLQAANRRDDLAHHRTERRVGRGQRRALHQHLLATGLLEVLEDDGVGSPGLTRP